MNGSPVKMIIAVAIAATLISPFTGAIAGNTGEVGVAGNVSADVGSYQEIEGYDVVTSNFTATDDGTTLSEGTDYELNETAGTIKFLSGSSTVTDGETVELDYSYQATDGTTDTIAGLLPLFVALLVLVTLAAGVINRL